MNTDAVVSQMNAQVSKATNNVQTAMSSNLTNSPEDMLKAQYAWQQYAGAVSWGSEQLKLLKELTMRVISNFG